MPVERETIAAQPARLGTELEEWIESLALVLERWRLPRMAGRIFGYLLICDPAECSAADVAAGTGASRGSISSMARILISQGLVERRRPLGSRVDLYRAADDAHFALLEMALGQLAALQATATDGLALLTERPPGEGWRLGALVEATRLAEGGAHRRLAAWRMRSGAHRTPRP